MQRVIFIMVLVTIIFSGCQSVNEEYEFIKYIDYAKEFQFNVPKFKSKKYNFNPSESVTFIYDESFCVESITLNSFREDSISFDNEVSSIFEELPIIGHSFREEQPSFECYNIDSISIIHESLIENEVQKSCHLITFKIKNSPFLFGFLIIMRDEECHLNFKDLIEQILCSFEGNVSTAL